MTDRMLAVLRWVAKHGEVPFGDTNFAAFRGLRDRGYIEFYYPYTRKPPVVFLTDKGKEALRSAA